MPKKIKLPKAKKALKLTLNYNVESAPYVDALLKSRKQGDETAAQTARRLLVEMGINHRMGETLESERQRGDSSLPIEQIVGERQMREWNQEADDLKKTHA